MVLETITFLQMDLEFRLTTRMGKLMWDEKGQPPGAMKLWSGWS